MNNYFNHSLMFNETHNGYRTLEWPRPEIVPQANITHIGNMSNISIILPGYTKKDIDISVEDDTLTVKTSEDFKEGSSDDQAHTEYKMEKFSRLFTIMNYDAENIESKLKNGILTITLHKSPQQQLRNIPIK